MSKSLLWLVTSGGSAFARHTDADEIKRYAARYKGSKVVQAVSRADAEMKFKKKKRAVR